MLRLIARWLGTACALATLSVSAVDLRGIGSTPWQRNAYNPEAVIPPQCYTKTEGRFNPCYTCHQNYVAGEGRANYMDDGELQGVYLFSEVGTHNHWRNLFKDRRADMARQSDAEILQYIAGDNYADLPDRLRARGFRGWIPDLAGLARPGQAFDAQGHARDGSGWVAFNYKPLPSTFWPTNGSTDDVMIRLPEAFRTLAGGGKSRAVYVANLAILEAAIKNLDHVDLPAVDEAEIGADLDGDGARGVARRLNRPAYYLGAAREVPVLPFLYPQGTEFLHTVRYVGVAPDGAIHTPARMKEVRYARKERHIDPVHLGALYDEERWDKEQGFLPKAGWQGDHGLLNGMGWRLVGFIEDAGGSLRPQTYEEMLFCKGCHTSIGATIDQTFAFARKVDGAAGWKYIDLRGMPDVPTRGDREGEILQYLRRVGGGDEFRANEEMRARWLQADGTPDVARIGAADVHRLITPSPARALALDKAYRAIVREQSYTQGRDAVLEPVANVYADVDVETPPLRPEHRYQGDIFLDWPVRSDSLVREENDR